MRRALDPPLLYRHRSCVSGVLPLRLGHLNLEPTKKGMREKRLLIVRPQLLTGRDGLCPLALRKR